jgi:lipopolysaccharide/colanic/teichoic acid biosynthesis glycosyltransferase
MRGVGTLRRLVLISIDVLLVVAAAIVAVMLRGDVVSIEDKLIGLLPYISISSGAAFVVFFAAGLDRTPWRYSSIGDHLQIIVLTGLAILLALVLTFVVNRLDGVARSLPVLHGGLIVILLISVRGAVRFWHARQIHINGNGQLNDQAHETVLVVGVNTVSELFLASVKEFARGRVQVAGLLVDEPQMRGRAVQQTPILGTVEELQDILQSLEVHGLAVNRIVVTIAADRLRPHVLEALLEVEKSSTIAIQFLSEQFGLETPYEGASVVSGQKRSSVAVQKTLARVGNVRDVNHANSTRKFIRLRKRIVDVLGATFLIITLAPVALFVASVVALDVGFPTIFWQQRPGLYGRPFRLYKFRTMRGAHDSHKRRIPDDQRSSAVGQLLRRTRLDELPQLYNVLIGDMSLIGPRPLLPRDQSPDYAARLLVRPGLTGWAQVNGGRIISTSDKLILDMWYVQNASLALDLAIVLRTVKMIFLGDRINTEAVNQARNNFGLKAVLRTTMVPAE